MRHALLGALLIVGGIAARIEAARHPPDVVSGPVFLPRGITLSAGQSLRIGGWPPTVYDVVRIGGWALLIFGAVIVAFALVRELRR